MWFTQISLRNPVFATMVMMAFVVLGLFSIKRLQVDQFPNVDFPVVVISTDYPGASPSIVENEVTKKIEESVNAIAGVNTLTSRSYEGVSVVVVEFGLHVNGRKGADDVREKVSTLRPSLPTDVKEPRILRFDPASRPIWSVAVLSKDQTPVELTQWTKNVLKKRLENVRGVGQVLMVGGTNRAINVTLDRNKMNAIGLTTDQITQALRAENQDLPVGILQTPTNETVVQLLAKPDRPQELGDIIVTRRNGNPIHLSEVATITDGQAEQDNVALYNSQPTLVLQIQKAQDENTVAVVDGLNATLEQLRPTLPKGTTLEPVTDGSRPIRVSVSNVRQTLIEGAILTILIVFLFLNSWRSTVITGLTLPIALIGTFFFMDIFGFTINMITLMAMTLSVGLLIDDAIVVRENIVRHVQMGKTPYQAAMDGTQEIGLAVLATTLSIVAVFLPIGFMGGIIGKFFHEFGITMVAAVLISMFVSFTLDPMLSSVWHDPAIEQHGKAWQPRTWYDHTIGRITHWFDGFQDELTSVYQSALGWSLRHKLATLLIAVLTFVASVMILPLLGSEFVPKADFSETSITFHTPVGTSMTATQAKLQEVDAVIRSFPEVRYTVGTINVGNAQGKIYANSYIRLVDRNQRSMNADQLSAKLRQRLKDIPGINLTHAGLLDSVGGNKQVEFSIQGDDLNELERLAQAYKPLLTQIPGLVDLDSSVKTPKPAINIELKRDLATELGLNSTGVANQLRTLVAGQTVGNWRAQDGQSYDVIVRLDETQRRSTQDLNQLSFPAGSLPDGSMKTTQLNQIASISPSTSPNQINRRNQNREVSFSANTFGRSLGEVTADINAVITKIPLPPGYRVEFGGSTKNMQESFGYAISALLMAVIFIYMILASQFQSFVQPLALMSSLPLTMIGVALALLMFGSSMSMFSVIGIVLLMGLVTKNAILLIDFAIRAMRGTDTTPPLDREAALLLAAEVRLRPILMTTLAMVFGMVPLAFALTEGSEQRAPMGQAVIGGVITSSILTLVVVPVIYCYLDDMVHWFKKKFRG